MIFLKAIYENYNKQEKLYLPAVWSALRYECFRKFLLEEMKIKPEELKKLARCSKCLRNINLLGRYNVRVNNYTMAMDEKGELAKQFIPGQEFRKEFPGSDKQGAIEYLNTLKDFSSIIIGHRK